MNGKVKFILTAFAYSLFIFTILLILFNLAVFVINPLPYNCIYGKFSIFDLIDIQYTYVLFLYIFVGTAILFYSSKDFGKKGKYYTLSIVSIIVVAWFFSGLVPLIGEWLSNSQISSYSFLGLECEVSSSWLMKEKNVQRLNFIVNLGQHKVQTALLGLTIFFLFTICKKILVKRVKA